MKRPAEVATGRFFVDLKSFVLLALRQKVSLGSDATGFCISSAGGKKRASKSDWERCWGD
jgi:hypothetical protein